MMRHRLLLVLAFVLPLLALPLAAQPTSPSAPPAKPLLAGCEVDYPPFCVVAEDGTAHGFSVELMRAALRAMGRDVTFRTAPWAEVKGWLERGEIQALPLVGRTPEREALFDFTIPYLTMHGAIVVRTDTEGIGDLKDLRGRRVAVMNGDNAEEFLRREDRGIEIIPTPTFSDAFRLLAVGRCDAVVIQRLVALRLLQETGIKNLRILDRPVAGFRQDFCFAVKEGDRDTLALLNEGLALVLADGTHRRLHAKWFAALELPSDRPILVGGDHNYPPYEYLDEHGQPAGFVVDLTHAIAREMGLNIRIELGPWAETVEKMRRGDLDAIQGMFYSPERDRFFDFSPPYMVSHYVSIVRKGVTPPEDVADLANLRVVVQENDLAHDLLLRHGLKSRLATAASQEEVLRALAAGRHDCAIAMRRTALQLIGRHGWQHLTLSRRPFLLGEYCYAVPDGHAALLAQFTEGLNAVKASGEFQRLHEKWLGPYDAGPLPWRTLFKYIGIVALPLLVLALLAFAWSWSLRRQVARRTAELEERETFIRTVLDNLPIGVAVNSISPGVTFDYMNDLFPRIYRTTRKALAAGPDAFWEAAYPDPKAREEIRARVLADCASGDPARMCWEDVPLTRQGEPDTYISARNTPVPGKGLMISTVWDVTARKKAEMEQQRSEALFRMLAETAPVGIVISDRDQSILYMNRRFTELVGYTPADIPTVADWWPLAYPDETLRRQVQQSWAETVQAARKTGLPSPPIEFPIVCKDRKVRQIEFRLAMSGDLHFILLSDVTEQRNIERQLLHAQKMESVGRLAGGVAHDFNNLLTGIINYVELCRDRVPPGDPVRAYLDEILHDSRRSADLTRQLLAFARKQTVAPRVLDLNATVAGMLNILRRLIGEDIDLAWTPGQNLWPVRMDTSQLDQILANLCVNARDAIGGVGKITIETANTVVDESYCRAHAEAVPGRFVTLAVSDNGCGMTREVLAHLFEPFFTTKPREEGTGLGLATVYGIVRQNEGFINVYSEPGKGTTFRIHLPRFEGQAAISGPAETPPAPAGGNETILLVEDERSVRITTALFLEKLGYTVLAAESPEEALRRAAEHNGPLHLLMTDVVLPGMSGRDLAARLAETRPQINCLYISGYTANVIAHRGTLDPGVHFLAKPFTRDALARKVREALAGAAPTT